MESVPKQTAESRHHSGRQEQADQYHEDQYESDFDPEKDDVSDIGEAPQLHTSTVCRFRLL